MTDAISRELLAGTWLTWDPENLTPTRWNRHVPLLAWIVERLAPRSTVEIGVGDGELFRSLCQVVDRFCERASVVGIDPWREDTFGDLATGSRYRTLADYCATRHPAMASLLRADPAEAVRDFADESVDLLCITAPVESGGVASLDPAAWLPKVKPGGVVVVSSIDELRLDGDTGKIWQQISEGLPSSSIELPTFGGIAQRPLDGATPLVDALRSDLTAATGLFRLLGERIEFRHALSSQPIGPAGVRDYVANLAEEHAVAVRRVQAESEVARQALDQRLASTYDRLVAVSSDLAKLQIEADYLLAKLADQGAQHERRVESLQAAHEAEWQRQRLELTVMEDRYSALERHAADQRAQIASIQATVSWKVTRPLRVVQRVRMKSRRRGN